MQFFTILFMMIIIFLDDPLTMDHCENKIYSKHELEFFVIFLIKFCKFSSTITFNFPRN